MHLLCIYWKQNLHSMQMFSLKITEVVLRMQQVDRKEHWLSDLSTRIVLAHKLKGTV